MIKEEKFSMNFSPIDFQVITDSFSKLLEFKDCYKNILDSIKLILPYDTATLFIFKNGLLKATAIDGFCEKDSNEVLNLTFDLNNRPFQEIWEKKTPIVVGDIKKTNFLQSKAGIEDMHSWMGIPLILKDSFVGVITLDKKEENFFTNEHIELAKLFSAVCSIALYKDLLYKEREILFKTVIPLIQSKNLQDSLNRVLDESMKLLEGKAGTVMLLSEDKKHLKIFAYKGIPDYEIVKLNNTGIPSDVGTFAETISTKSIIEVYDTKTDPRVAKGFGVIPEKLLNIPLMADNEVMGILTLDANTENEEERELLLMFGKMAGTIIKQFDILERFKELNSDLKILSEVAKNISSLTDTEELFRKTADLIMEQFKVYYVSIFLLDSQRKELIYKWGSGYDWEELKDNFRLPLDGPGITVWVVNNNKPLMVNNVKDDKRFVVVEATKKVNSELALPIRVKGEVIGVLDLESEEVNSFKEDDVMIFQTLADQLGVVIENSSLYYELKQLATTDGLTGLLNHRRFYEILEEELIRFSRYNGHLSLLFMDINGFKKYNDTFGHLEGDKLLKKVAEVISKNVRKVDKAARYGGDEFAILLPSTDNEKANIVANRLLQAFKNENISTSIGIVSINEEDHYSKEELLKAADEALYEAKRTNGTIKNWKKESFF